MVNIVLIFLSFACSFSVKVKYTVLNKNNTDKVAFLEESENESSEATPKSKFKIYSNEDDVQLDESTTSLDSSSTYQIKEKADQYYGKAESSLQLENPQKAIENYIIALKLYTRLNDTKNIAETKSKIGNIWDQVGNYSKAILYFIDAYHINLQNKNYKELSRNLNDISRLFIVLSMEDRALPYLNKSIEYANRTKNLKSLAYAYNLMAIISFTKNKLDQAKDYTHKTLNISTQLLNNSEIKSLSFTNLAKYYLKINKLDSAEKYLEISYKIALINKLNYPKIYALLNLQLLKNAEANFIEAKKISDVIINISDKLEMTPIKVLTLSRLKTAYAKQQLYKEAYETQEKVNQLKDKLELDKHVQNVSRLTAEFDFEKKEIRNNKIREDQKEELLSRIEKQKIILFFSILILGILCISAYISFKDHGIQKEINKDLLVKNIEIEKNRKEINKQSKKLLELNEHKDQIFTIISHDLKKPIEHLSSVLDLIENDLVDTADLQMLIPSISKNVKNTSQILDSLLLWSKSQLNGFSLKLSSENLYNFIEDRTNTLIPFADEKSIELVNDIRKDLIINLDTLITTIVIRNLVLNAIKFSVDGKKIVISVTESPEFFALIVKDEGIGMTKKQLDNLFTVNTRSTRGTKSETGTGLGLIFCRDLVNKSGGSLKLESKENEGTSAIFTIPKYTI